MQNTYLEVPKSQMKNYAQGYTDQGKPVRMTPGVLATEAYGIRTTASDMVLFLSANMRLLKTDEKLQRAIIKTQTGYYKVGTMTQDLIWEQYPYPVSLQDLLDGNSNQMSAHSNPVTRLDPPVDPQENVLIDKTGSTAGFATYIALIPKKKIGVILLANKNYPRSARVKAAYEILERLGEEH
jgi:beta-lactamase class C